MAYKKIGEIKDLSEIGGNSRTALATFLNLGTSGGQNGTYRLYHYRNEETQIDIIFPDVYIVIATYNDYVKNKNHDGTKKVTLNGIEYSLYLPDLDELKLMLGEYTEDETARNMSSVADNTSVRTMSKRNFTVENRYVTNPTYIVPLLKGKSNNPPSFEGLDDFDYGKISHKPEPITFTAIDRDNSDIVSLKINVDGKTVIDKPGNSNKLTYTYDFSFFDSIEYGKHTIEFVAIDSKNISVSKTITLEKTKEPISYIPEDTSLINSSVALYSIENELEYQNHRFSDFLKNNDIDANPNDCLSTLIDKLVANGFGRKFASGTSYIEEELTNLKYFNSTTSPDSYYCILVENLDFKPEVIIAYSGRINYSYWSGVYIDIGDINICLAVGAKSQYSNPQFASIVDIKDPNIKPSENVYRVPVGERNSTILKGACKWIAFGR